MTIRWCTYLIVLSLGLLMFGCGGGSAGLDNNQPEMASVLVEKPAADPSARAASDLIYPFEDPTPEDLCWDLIFGQTMYFGHACLVQDDEDNWFMEWTLDEDLIIASGWVDETYSQGYDPSNPFYGFCDAAVEISTSDDIPAQAGHYTWKWDSNGDETLIQGSWSMPLPGFDLEDGPYIAIHTTICKGIWVDGEFVETGNETGWGGFYNRKDGDGAYWEFSNWKGNRWGGYNMIGSGFGFPDDSAYSGDEHTYRGFRWFSSGPTYWDIVFMDIEPDLPMGSFGFYNNGGLPAYDGNKAYYGWCVDNIHSMNTNHNYDVVLYSSYFPNIVDPCADSHGGDAGLPILTNGNLEFINFMINQRYNPDPGGPWDVAWNATYRNQMQNAIWYFTNGLGLGGGSIAESMAEYAIANGDNYAPHVGEWYGILLVPNPAECAHGTNLRAQMNIIEVDP